MLVISLQEHLGTCKLWFHLVLLCLKQHAHTKSEVHYDIIPSLLIIISFCKIKYSVRLTRGFARFGSHEVPFAKPGAPAGGAKRVYFNRFYPLLVCAPICAAYSGKQGQSLQIGWVQHELIPGQSRRRRQQGLAPGF